MLFSRTLKWRLRFYWMNGKWADLVIDDMYPLDHNVGSRSYSNTASVSVQCVRGPVTCGYDTRTNCDIKANHSYTDGGLSIDRVKIINYITKYPNIIKECESDVHHQNFRLHLYSLFFTILLRHRGIPRRCNGGLSTFIDLFSRLIQ